MTEGEVLDQIGEAAALEQTAEECAELAHACLKMARKFRAENPTPVAEVWISASIHEEVADLMNCMDMILRMPWVNAEKIRSIKEEKMKRWHERVFAGR